MADIFSVPTFDPQDRINEAVDESKGHIHRLFMIGIFLGFSVAAWGLGRAFQSTYIVSAILLRQRRISWETIAAVRSITMVAAWGLGRAFQSTYIVSAILLRQQNC